MAYMVYIKISKQDVATLNSIFIQSGHPIVFWMLCQRREAAKVLLT
jgi:hypothetical protein